MPTIGNAKVDDHEKLGVDLRLGMFQLRKTNNSSLMTQGQDTADSNVSILY